LPGIGPDRANGLLERFKTVRACFSASTAELMEVEGIGPKTAAAIDQVINWLVQWPYDFCWHRIVPGLRPVPLFSLPAATGVAKARKVLGGVGNRNVLRKILAEYWRKSSYNPATPCFDSSRVTDAWMMAA
jgi:endonuclease III